MSPYSPAVLAWLATGCGLGRFPFSGTLASVTACLAAVPVRDSAWPDRLEWAVLAGLACAICLAGGGAVERALGRKDPPDVVADEFAGQWLALAIAAPGGHLPLLLLALALFRLFDGVKPFGLKALQKIPGAAGILVDDLAAGALAGGLTLAAGLFA